MTAIDSFKMRNSQSRKIHNGKNEFIYEYVFIYK